MTFDLQLALSEPHYLHVYPNDVVIERHLKFTHPSKGKKGTRSCISELSHRALKRLAFFASNCATKFHVMLTLTYPENYTNDGKLVKSHLNHFLIKLRRRQPNIKYFWYLEFQLNGSPHFHIFLSTKWIEMDFVSLAWYDVVGSENIDHLTSGTKVEGIRDTTKGVKYALKYAVKCYQKIVPEAYQNVGRFWGHSEGIEPQIIHSIQVLGYDDCQHFLRFWKNAHMINHNLIISVLWNVSKYLPVPKL